MKKALKLLVLAAALFIVCHAGASTSAPATTVEKWGGSGSVYTPGGQELETYTVEVTKTYVSPTKILLETVSVSANGSRRVITQELEIQGDGWKVQSNLGTGAGACYGKDLCQNYIADTNGMAYATTIVKDGADVQRQMTTVLENGKAKIVLRQTVSRI